MSPCGPPEWLGLLRFIPNPEEGDFGILEAATGSPSRGSGGWEAHAALGDHRGLCGILTSILC